MKFLSSDEANDRTSQSSNRGNDWRLKQNGNNTGEEMSPSMDGVTNSIEEIFSHIQSLLCQTWEETGFGCLVIESDRKNKKIRVIVKGSTHYRYVITDEQVNEWVSRKSS